MCTVTFIPTATGIHLTSNRDERQERARAVEPARFSGNGYELVFPKDPEAGGSWIALKDNGDAAVLLNGAFIKHLRKPPYRRSRGLVLLEVIEAINPGLQFRAIDLEGVEPFTLVLFSGGQLWECRWDGFQKHALQLDAAKPYIWSSVTLYDDLATALRKHWFADWLLAQKNISTEDILDFHQHAGNGDIRNDLVMNRDNNVHTVSITSIFMEKDHLHMKYRNLHTGGDTERMLGRRKNNKETPLNKWLLCIRRLIIRATHWEYWPSALVYGPVYAYWLWLSIKARSFFFFSAANPGIRYAGFAQERKNDIYKLIPERYYPRTLFYYAGTSPAVLIAQLPQLDMPFPLIAKPDMGERGVQVKLIQTIEDLENYCRLSKVDFLIQAYIDYPLEAGIFYYRMPGERNGHISGIVGKEFLSVIGDGQSDIATLLKKDDRAFLQLPALREIHGSALDLVLPTGVQQVIVPYGNHSRGALFTDESHRINEQLTAAIDKVCKQIPGFYYGRLDIKFRTWDDLNEGKDFSIIELNGAGSEPTHIYDPAHSLFFAWKEICRHWGLLYRISKLNADRKGLSLMTVVDGMRMLQDHTRHLKQVKQL